MEPWLDDGDVRLYHGDVREVLRALPAESVQTCVTSPPYFGLRDYGSDGQIGLEPTPAEYVAALVGVFREVRRVLRDDGTVWLNLGDSYANPSQSGGGDPTIGARNLGGVRQPKLGVPDGLKPKDLIGVPWRVAFALQADSWYLRSDIVWSKPNPMPESVTDRPTKSHEYVFLLAKGPRYFYDADAIREDAIHAGQTVTLGEKSLSHGQATGMNREPSGNGKADSVVVAPGRNKRSVWTVTTQPYPGAHFAVFPPKLIEPCILAGTSPQACGQCGAPWQRVVEREPNPTKGATGPSMAPIGPNGETDARYRSHSGTIAGAPPRTTGWKPTCDHHDDTGRSTVLDPFSGSGTTAWVARHHGRKAIGIDLSEDFLKLAASRLQQLSLMGG